jgi:D-glycero-alpha-D-manno-heptose-7-phosphate kinase
MVITRTPFRISFFGGGTDYPVWYEQHGGAVLSTAIDKYCYITCRNFPPFFEHPLRVVWSKVEMAKSIDDVEHPAVKGVMKFFNLRDGLEINHVADLPARSGLGAGSSFVVGLIKAIYALQGKKVSRYDLIQNAIHVERNIMNENVGSQDQVAAVYGGFNKIVFRPDNKIEVIPLNLTSKTMDDLRDHLLLFFTGLSRSASAIAGEQVKNTPNKEKDLHAMHGMVDQGIAYLEKGKLDDFGKLLHESWQLKRGLSSLISNDHIDAIYAAARNAGALGGKLLGAGGGGFMLVYADPGAHKKIKEALKDYLCVPFDFDTEGSQVIYDGGKV